MYATATTDCGVPTIELDRLEQDPPLQDLDVNFFHAATKSPKDLLLRKLQSASLDLIVTCDSPDEAFEDLLILQESLECESAVIHEVGDDESDYQSSVARIVPLRSLDWARRVPLVHLFSLLSSHDVTTFQLLQRNHTADLIALMSDLWLFVKERKEFDRIKSDSLAVAGLLQGVHGLNWWKENVSNLPQDLPLKDDPIACFAELMSRIISDNSFSCSVKICAWICADQLLQKQPQPLARGAWTVSAAGKPVLPYRLDWLLVQPVGEEQPREERKKTQFLSDPRECLWRKCRDSQEATHLRLFTTTTGPDCGKFFNC
ncbi:hypothetical protein Ciccas_004979 [Cichlidogyrus casuarinus]|uniref:Uncharacterized protein n=1 Tax=Cichlidogyrus casuarinus TaxID=1844966 RepID=A0ABD2Q9Y7_9PLAT